MNISVKFWERVAEDIEEKYSQQSLKSWDESQIRTFLTDLENKVLDFCEKDHQKAKRCGVPFIKGKYATKQWKPISTSTFRRIFITKDSSGKEKTKQQFAIYLGFDSFEEYVNEKNINFSNNLFSKNKKQETQSPDFRKNNSKLLSISTILMATLLLLFLIFVFFLEKNEIVETRRRILAVTTALLSGIFVFMLTGDIKVKLNFIKQDSRNILIESTGGITIFLIVLFWWSSSFSPIKNLPIKITHPINGTTVLEGFSVDWHPRIAAFITIKKGNTVIFNTPNPVNPPYKIKNIKHGNNYKLSVESNGIHNHSIIKVVPDPRKHNIAEEEIIGIVDTSSFIEGSIILPLNSAIDLEIFIDGKFTKHIFGSALRRHRKFPNLSSYNIIKREGIYNNDGVEILIKGNLITEELEIIPINIKNNFPWFSTGRTDGFICSFSINIKQVGKDYIVELTNPLG